MISVIYNTVFYHPLYNCFVFLVDILPFHSVGLAIIILTLAVRLILFPLSHKSVVTQRKIKQIEPEIEKIKNKFKANKQEQSKQVMALYKEHGISPFSGFFMMLVQFPVFIALFMILKSGADLKTDLLYGFIKAPGSLNTMFLGILDVSRASYFVAALAAVSQFFQVKLSMPKMTSSSGDKKSFSGELQKSMGLQMKYIMPVFIFFIAMRFASGMALYWTTSNVFAILHEIIVSYKAKKLEHGRENSINKTGDRSTSFKTDG